MARTLVALGGNALARAGGGGTWAEAVTQIRRTSGVLAELVRGGHELVLTHGNGPQVGHLLRQNELAEREIPARPMDVLGAETQGQVGYLIAQELTPALRAARVPRTVVAFVGRMVVAARDSAFRHPTKPVGRFYSDSEARILRKGRGWAMTYDAARGGWRRVVPSPKPVRWVEGPVFRSWVKDGLLEQVVPVVTGGGGIPVIERHGGRFEGVEAVIDKDLSAAVVARETNCEVLAIVTDVPAVAVGFGKRWERWLGEITVRELGAHQRQGEFGRGTMAPKVQAAIDFLRAGGRQAIITDIPSLDRALHGEAGTRVGSPAHRRRTRS